MAKILLFIPRLAVAGAETMVQDLAIGLKRNGVEVKVAVFYEAKSPIINNLVDANIQIDIIEKKVGFDIGLYRQLYKYIKKEKPDTVHTHLNVDKYVVPICKMLGVKRVVHTVHNIAALELKKADRFITKFLARMKWVTLVGISPEIKNSICNEYNLNSNDVPMIFNGRDLSQFIPKQNYSIENNFKILHVGRFSKQKNHSMLIEAFATFSSSVNSKLYLAGEGKLLSEIMAKVENLGLGNKVIFLGLQNNIHELMIRMDAFVLPSLYEGMPITIIEAMAAGLPVIATSVGGVSDMIDNGTSGLLIKNDCNELINSLNLLATDRNLRETIGKTAHNESKKFSVDVMVGEYKRIYNNHN